MGGSRAFRWVGLVGLVCTTALVVGLAADRQAPVQKPSSVVARVAVQELPVHKIPIPGEAAEGYFSPDGKSMICNAKMADDKQFQVYTFKLDGTDVRRINDKGADACSFWFPDGKKLIWTSTRDNLDMPPGNYSDANDYPQGAELYTSDLDGSHVVRMTNNKVYDAEVTVSPDGKWILFGRADRREDGPLQDAARRQRLFQITHTPDWQEGGAQWMPDGKTHHLPCVEDPGSGPARHADADLHDQARRHRHEADHVRSRHQLGSVPRARRQALRRS